MNESKTYHVPLQSNLSGWKRVRVQVDVLSTGSKQRMVKLQEEFEVNPIEGDTASYAVSDKQLINEGSSVEFYVTVASDLDPLSGQHIQGTTLEVRVKLDLSAMAQSVGAIAAGMIPGMGFMGGTIAQGIPQEMDLLTGIIEVNAQNAVFEITLKKPRWLPLEKKKLNEYMTPEDIKQLFQYGGELWVPVQIEPEQQAKGETIHFDSGIEIYDVEGELNWLGTRIVGEYRDEDRTCMVFGIQPGADMSNASDLAPGSPTQGPQIVGQA